jgi:hypothetical protein
MSTIFYASERYWQRSKEDAIANRLMDEMVPRAQAVDPSLQGPADAIAADMPGLGTGGVDELRMRFRMAEQAKLINSAACDVICVGLHAFDCAASALSSTLKIFRMAIHAAVLCRLDPPPPYSRRKNQILKSAETAAWSDAWVVFSTTSRKWGNCP